MNREFDREIDALLRRHTRAAARGRVLEDEGAAHSPQSEHLDADELSAFAENALPAAARSLYVSHLADCADCRHAAAGLASTSNVSAESERKASAVNLKASEASARGGWLSALFAPRVLRYAFPALALCLVGVVAFVALRSMSPQEGGQVAQHKESDEGRAVATRQAPAPPSSGIGASDGGATQNANASIVAGGSESGQSSQTVQPVEQRAGGEGVLKDTTATGPAPSLPEPVTAAQSAPPPPAMDTREAVGVVAEAAPKALAKEKGEETKLSDSSARERQSNEAFTYNQSQNQVARGGQPRKVDIDQMPDGSRNVQRSEQQSAGSRANNTLPMLSREQKAEEDRAATTSATRARPAPRRDRSDDEESNAGAETRSVSNHRFRRQGGVWVDVKYSTSLPTVGVRRGTDAYRALVADIPELGRIAGQLAGEIVVVVKGRAYRIR